MSFIAERKWQSGTRQTSIQLFNEHIWAIFETDRPKYCTRERWNFGGHSVNVNVFYFSAGHRQCNKLERRGSLFCFWATADADGETFICHKGVRWSCGSIFFTWYRFIHNTTQIRLSNVSVLTSSYCWSCTDLWSWVWCFRCSFIGFHSLWFLSPAGHIQTKVKTFGKSQFLWVETLLICGWGLNERKKNP